MRESRRPPSFQVETLVRKDKSLFIYLKLMTVKDVFELRKQGRIEEAYAAICPMYAEHKGHYTTIAMFWTATDVLKLRLKDGKVDEALLIYKALLRLLPNLDDSSGVAHSVMVDLALRLAETTNQFSVLDMLEVLHLGENDWKPTTSKSGWTIPALAKRMLMHVFVELRQSPSVDDALRVMPLLEEAMKRYPDDKDNLLHMASVYEIMGEKKKAEEVCSDVSNHIMLGKWGEEIAAAYLREQGYVILECDWRSGHRDIDIIARDADYLVFVEVKTRSNTDFHVPEFAVDHAKRVNLNHAIGHYIHSHHIECKTRFDTISVVGTIGSTPEINHYKDICITELKPRR